MPTGATTSYDWLKPRDPRCESPSNVSTSGQPKMSS